MAVKQLTCKLTLEVNGKEVHGNFVTTKKELREVAEMTLKSILVTAERI